MQKEIGSNFDLNKDSIIDKNTSDTSNLDELLFSLGTSGADSVYLSTGRGAERFVLDIIQKRSANLKKIALIPPFTCETVIEPFLSKNYEIVSYPIEEDLSVNIDKFENTLISSNAAVVLLHRYFGFDTLNGMEALIKKYRKNGIIFIEDKTQSLYSNCPALPVDFIVGSFRKWAALPDGGYAFCKEGWFSNKPEISDMNLEIEKIDAFHLKYEYLQQQKGKKQVFLDKMKAAEDILDAESEFYQISRSGKIIQLNLDLDILKSKRRENYAKLYVALKNFKSFQIVTPQLEKKEAPLYFVIKSKNRDKIQLFLRNHDIYAPIVWPKANHMPAICTEAQDLYDTILCIPIDQRYDLDDMDRVVGVMKEYEKRCLT